MDQRNRIESPETNPHTYAQLIFDKAGKTPTGKKFSENGVGKAGQLHVNQ